MAVTEKIFHCSKQTIRSLLVSGFWIVSINSSPTECQYEKVVCLSSEDNHEKKTWTNWVEVESLDIVLC